MSGLLEDRVAIITGGVGGIGATTARRFLAEGASVVVSDIQDEAGAALVEQLGSRAAYVHADVTDEASIEALVASTVQRFGRLDVMFNNAGLVGDRAPITELGAESFDAVMALDVRSVLLGHKYAARQFIAQGGGGSIITTASIAGLQGGWSAVAYTAAKHAVAGIIHQSAYELGPLGIRSNAMAPGVIMTGFQARVFGVPPERAGELNEFIVDRMGDRQPMGRFGVPEDIAGVATFLASDLSAYVNGVVIPVDGGATAASQSDYTKQIVATTREFRERG